MQDLEIWLKENMPEIQRVQSLLANPLSNNPAILADQLSDIESWGSRMLILLADSNAYLDEAEQRELMKISGEKRALDREVELAAAVVKERRLRDILDGICRSISGKLILGQSVLKANSRETNLHTSR